MMSPSFIKITKTDYKVFIVSLLINRQNRKPVSVLTCHLSSRPTPRKRAGSSSVPEDAPVYMVFLVLVPSPSYVATRRRELLPRGFTLTLTGGLFSVTACKRLLPSVISTAGCPFQSGLSSESEASEETVYPQSPLATAPRGMRSSLCSDRQPIVLTSSTKTRTRSRRLMPSW